MELIFASHNEHKVEEIRAILPERIRLLSLNDIGFQDEIEETGSTLEANAQIKAETIFKLTGKNVFADDTGLFVEALNGLPGVHSARYAGTGKFEDNIVKLLNELNGKTNRNAYFKTVICLIWEGKKYFPEGIIEGQIQEQAVGSDGFGYDPLFLPDGFQKTFAEMTAIEKNHISHRFIAVQKLIEILENF